MQRIATMILLLCLIVTALLAESTGSQSSVTKQGERFVARIDNPLASTYDAFSSNGFDVCAYSPGEYLDVLVNDTIYRSLQGQYPNIRITQTEARLKSNLVSKSKDLPGYRDYQTMLDELLLIQAAYPNLVQVVSLGNTWGTVYAENNISTYQGFNHQIWAVKLSNNVSQTEDEPAFYFAGEHHAREPISMETVMGILTYLVEGYGNDNAITNRLNSSEIWLVPLINPNGHKLVIDQSDVWWRKNIRDNNLNTQINYDEWGYGYDGVDLNRNYSYERGYLSASDDPNMPTFRGLEAFSEPETQAFRNLLLSRNFVAGISYHTYGQYVLYPFGYMQSVLSPDYVEMQALANSMATLLPKLHATGNYTAMPSYALYPASGTLDDWAYGERGIFAYTIEMADEFIPPAEDVPEIVEDNVIAAMQLLDRKNTRILKGHITDALTGLPLKAMVYVYGLDSNPLRRKQYYSDEQFGSYYRLLSEGTYTVQYICPGYAMEQFTISISGTEPTINDVALLAVEPVDLHIEVLDQFGNPLSDALLSFIESGNSYITNIDGEITINGFFPGAYRIALSCNGFETVERIENITGDSRTFILGSNTVFADDFESGLGAWNTGTVWGSGFISSSGFSSLTDSPLGNYADNQTVNCRISQAINLNGALNVNLQFYAKYDIALDGDYCLLAYSTNGTTWRSIASFSGIADWQQYSYNLNNLSGSSIYLRFTLSSNDSGNSDGIYIDNFKLYSTSFPSALDDTGLPSVSPLLNRFPNPFQEKLTICLSDDAKLSPHATLNIYNIRGQRVKKLCLGDAGKQILVWDGMDDNQRKCANGMYFLRLVDRQGVLATAKVILVK